MHFIVFDLFRDYFCEARFVIECFLFRFRLAGTMFDIDSVSLHGMTTVSVGSCLLVICNNY